MIDLEQGYSGEVPSNNTHVTCVTGKLLRKITVIPVVDLLTQVTQG
jgi:hypothetical protein